MPSLCYNYNYFFVKLHLSLNLSHIVNMIHKQDSKVHEIAQLLLKQIEKHEFNKLKLSLFSGNFGIILFLSHYLRSYPNEEKQKLFNCFVEDCFDILISNKINHTYCDGLTGILSCLKYMNQVSLFNIDFSEIEQEYENYLFNMMVNEFQKQHYDVLHGGLGVALYFVDKPRFVEYVVSWLESNADRDENRVRWSSVIDYKTQKRGYNISLSHGISSIIVVFCRIHQRGLFTDRVKVLIMGAVEYILSQELDPAEYGCFFPSQSFENGDVMKKSRLGWCYGDLGIATTLWQAGRTLGNEFWKDKAIAMMKHSIGRKDLESNNVNDCALCHGSAGIAMMFRYMYDQTKDDTFKGASAYWIKMTIDMAVVPDGLAGYKRHIDRREDLNLEVDENYFLEGVTGIGLMLLSSIDNKISCKWMELLLLS